MRNTWDHGERRVSVTVSATLHSRHTLKKYTFQCRNNANIGYWYQNIKIVP